MDFDDGHCPSWRNQLQGLYNVFLAVRNQLPGTGALDKVPVMMLRPRAWNMMEHHVMVKNKQWPFLLFLCHHVLLFIFSPTDQWSWNSRAFTGLWASNVPQRSHHGRTRVRPFFLLVQSGKRPGSPSVGPDLYMDGNPIGIEIWYLKKICRKPVMNYSKPFLLFHRHDQELRPHREYFGHFWNGVYSLRASSPHHRTQLRHLGLFCINYLPFRFDNVGKEFKKINKPFFSPTGRRPEFVISDRVRYVNIDQLFLSSYIKLLIKVCHKRGALATGGMAALILDDDNSKSVLWKYYGIRHWNLTI